ncbi:endoglucanase [Spirosomataceae bacterium TFI 002]|nr:endoglucanase [Spirosomataceae bacterium TFI 002]
MKNIIGILFFCPFLLMSCAKKESLNSSKIKENSFKVHRGTNIAHWLSQSKKRGEDRAMFFTEADVAFIDSVGFDHIRMPVDEEQLWDQGGNRNEEAFKLLDNFLGWAQKYELKVILDLHKLRSHHFNATEKPLWEKPEEQQKFIKLWKDLASAVNKYPNSMLAYEFMNEPVADTAEEWNKLLGMVADSIRSWEPKRVLVIGSNRWQSVNTFDELRVPANDKNILLSFHFYEPFYLSHYRASWTKMKDFAGEVNYPGQIVVNGVTQEEKRIYNRESLEKMMAKPIHLADSLGLPLYCGEFGIIDGSPENAKLAWYKDMVAIFEKHKIGYANWNYKAGSFGIVDKDMKPRGEYVEILTKEN